MQFMVKLLTGLYRVLLLVVLCVIAFYARLIYERMPMTEGEWRATMANPDTLHRLVDQRLPVVGFAPGSRVDVNVTNTDLDVNLVGKPIDVKVTNDPLTVEVDNEVRVSGAVSIER